MRKKHGHAALKSRFFRAAAMQTKTGTPNGATQRQRFKFALSIPRKPATEAPSGAPRGPLSVDQLRTLLHTGKGLHTATPFFIFVIDGPRPPPKAS